MIQAPLIILAGGFGTRLHSVLKGLPKPLADINGTPFLQYLFQNWVEQGFRDFVLSLHYESEKMIEFVESQKETTLKNCQIRCITEPKPMGTGGAISYLLNQIQTGETFFVANADTWVESGYSILNETDGNVIGMVKVEDTSRYGSVELGEGDLIKGFIEKNDRHEEGYINAGVYKLSRSLFGQWNGQPFSLESDFFPELIERKLLKGKVVETGFIDIGIPEDYYKFCQIKQDIK